MNREILFKAKRIDNGKWVEGYLMDENYINVPFDDYDACGRFDDPVEINPETLCQYTGLEDKNGKKIWENDLLGHKLNRVEFLNGVYCTNGDRSLFFEAKTKEVIGNIFDNPELLEM